MQPLAANVASALTKSKQKSVVVLDFVGSNNKFSELGRTLAEKFSADLVKSSDKFSVLERKRIAESLAKKGLTPDNVWDADAALWVAADLGVQSVVFGALTESGDHLSIEIDCYSVKSEKRVDGAKATWLISDEMRKLVGQIVEYPKPESDSGIPVATKNGYTHPNCVYCPPATYTAEALKNRLDGTVTLMVVVGTDGKADDIVVKKPLRDGLTEKAIEAVKSWKFTPALGPDGKPAAVQQVIEVMFRASFM